MSVSVKELKTYTSFARRFAGKFVRDRFEERRVPLLPAPHRPEPATWSLLLLGFAALRLRR